MSQIRNIKRWIDRINDSSSSDTVVIDALMKIRPYSKKKSGIRNIEQNGGITCFMKLIQKPNKRILDISISLLANCLTEESSRKQVVESQGVPQIVKLLQSIKCTTILTRACRSIANLACNMDCSKTLHAIGTVELIVQLIKLPSTPVECLTSALRAVKNLANTPGHRKKLIEHGVVSVINKILKTREKDLVPAAVRALVEISKSCTIEFADHMLGNDGAPIKTLVEVIEDCPDASCMENTLSIIVILTLQGCARPAIGNVGGLKCIVQEMKTIINIDLHDFDKDSETTQGPLPENASRLLGALCYCCREAINRARLRSLDALQIFIRILSDNRWTNMHPFILTSLLCFLYDEEGLKVLHDHGIFAVLLDKLQYYTTIERETFEETNTSKTVWDGHDIDGDENFDRRHSLSSDIATKFNQRPTASLIPDGVEKTFEALGYDWGLGEEIPPYSPQWSPAGPSPVPSELAFVDDSSPPDTPPSQTDTTAKVSLDSLESRLAISSTSQGTYPTCGDHIQDEDDSSSSRDSFDQMHSPALLPATGKFNLFQDNLETLFAEKPSTNKRDRISSSGSHVSNNSNQSVDEDADSEVNFDVRMQKDLRQAPKRAKIDNLKYTGNDRIRSRSLDAGASNKNAGSVTPTVVAEVQRQSGPSSPPSENIIPEIGSAACSPKFLKFVNETCSVSPQFLKHAGKEMAHGSSSSGSTTFVKQPKRRTSGASRKLEEIVFGSANNASSEDVELGSREEVPSKLTKTSSNPLPIGNEKITVVDAADDSSLTGPEPLTPMQVILCLLCHYCEVSENYIVSLALQDNCAEALAFYMRECPKAIDAKCGKIIDKLSGSTKCFSKMVSASVVTLLTSTAVLRTPLNGPSSQSDSLKICDMCGMDFSFDCLSIVDNAWHNTALCHSSSYGSHLLKAFLTKGTEREAATSLCVVVLLFLWYWERSEFKSMSDELRKRLLSNLLAIADKNQLELLWKVLQEFPSSSKDFQCIAYVFHELATISYRELKTKSTIRKFEESKSECSSSHSQKLSSVGTKSNDWESICAYAMFCQSEKPDRVLTFPVSQDASSLQSRTRRRKTTRNKNAALKSKVKCSELPVHSHTLSEQSPMFAAMFQGKYRESKEKTITIHDVPFRSALYIVHDMYGCNSDECTEMKNMLQKMHDSSDTRYKQFSGCNEDGPGHIPWEVDVLRVMDLWLLSDARIKFYRKYENFFRESYITPEISGIASDIRQEESDRKVKVISKDDEGQSGCGRVESVRTMNSKCPFWDFVNGHGFSDITQNYVCSFFSPCLFNHNHLLRAKVLKHIHTISHDGDSFIKIVISSISSNFSKLVHQLQSSRKLD